MILFLVVLIAVATAQNPLAYLEEKPIEKIFMYDVQYDLFDEILRTDPIKMSQTIVENFTDQPQRAVRTITSEETESSSFTYTKANQLGVAIEIKAKVPVIGKMTELSDRTFTFETGDTVSTTAMSKVQFAVKLPARSKVTVVVSGTEYKADIPYTATVRTVYYDGTEAFDTISGVYKGVVIRGNRLTYGKIEHLD